MLFLFICIITSLLLHHQLSKRQNKAIRWIMSGLYSKWQHPRHEDAYTVRLSCLAFLRTFDGFVTLEMKNQLQSITDKRNREEKNRIRTQHNKISFLLPSLFRKPILHSAFILCMFLHSHFSSDAKFYPC